LFPPRRWPLVVTIHDTVAWTHPETLTRRGAHWHRATAERAARVADAISVPTRAVADELVSQVRRLPAERVHVLGAGVTTRCAGSRLTRKSRGWSPSSSSQSDSC
jgi:hypothetical protein